MPDAYPKIRGAIARRSYRGAFDKATTRLRRAALDEHLHAALTVIYGYFGDYPSLGSSYGEAMGSGSLTVMREVAYADALSALGRAHEAAALRRELIVENRKPDRELHMYARLVADLLSIDDLEGAHEAAWEAVALAPESGTGWALVARVEAAQGQAESAQAHLWLAERTQDEPIEVAIAGAQVLLAQDEPEAALSLFNPRLERDAKSTRYTAAYARTLLAADRTESVLDLFDARIWFLRGELWHPAFQATYGAALARAGHPDLAESYADRLQRTYPDSAQSRADVTDIRARLSPR